ncbi:MAG: hypothetical protein IPN70_01190 [Candidatus Moraniibacteriota bacterium]|nr:MAG: hypothetical protein IPN70_01190 [Candidatus Moranbacteria bacterium]
MQEKNFHEEKNVHEEPFNQFLDLLEEYFPPEKEDELTSVAILGSD